METWREELYLSHTGIPNMKWGVRRFQNYDGSLTPEGRKRYGVGEPRSAKHAEEIAKHAARKEPKISKDVRSAVEKYGSKMYGFENRLKTKESIQRKIETDTPDIKDAVRYTSLTSDKDFVKNHFHVKEDLENKGYQEVKCKNNWDAYQKGLVKHKSVQSVFKDPDGYLFEIQFHTPDSQKAKNDKIPLYEEVRKPGVTAERKAEIERQMELLAEKVQDPKDIKKIKSH